QPRHIAPAVAAPGDAAGLHAFPADARRSAARRDRARRARARPRRPWRAASGPAGGLRALARARAGGALLLARWWTRRVGARWRTQGRLMMRGSLLFPVHALCGFGRLGLQSRL